jgi:hypothetical protein
MAASTPFPPFPEPPGGPDPLEELEGITAATVLQGNGHRPAPTSDERRIAFRSPVEAVRSIGLMLLDNTGYAASPWLVADILDVSRGGLCLLLAERPDKPFRPHFRVRLNVSMHPDFGQPELAGSLRWFVRAEHERVVTLGVQFDQELPRLPTLLACRRDQPRVLGQ